MVNRSICAAMLALTALCAGVSCSDPGEPASEPTPGKADETSEAPESIPESPSEAEPPVEPADLPEAVPFESDAELDAWIQHYYERPHPQRAVYAFRWLSENGRLDDKDKRRGVPIFFARVLAANDEHADEWARELDDLPPLHRALFAQSLVFADTERCLEAVRNMAERTEDESLAQGLREMHKLPRIDPMTMALDAPAVTTMIWAEFCATGNPEAIERMASLGYQVVDRTDPTQMAVAAKAMHELTIHAANHPFVYNTLIELAARSEGSQQQALHNAIDDAGVLLDQRREAERLKELDGSEPDAGD